MAIARGTNVVSVCLTEEYIYINNTSAIYESQMNETWYYWVTGYVYTSWLRSSFFEPTYFSEIGQEIRLTFWTRWFSLLSSPCIHWDVTKIGWQLIGVRSVLTVPFIEYRIVGLHGMKILAPLTHECLLWTANYRRNTTKHVVYVKYPIQTHTMPIVPPNEIYQFLLGGSHRIKIYVYQLSII